MRRFFSVLSAAAILFSVSAAEGFEKSEPNFKNTKTSLQKNFSHAYGFSRVQQNLIGEVIVIDSAVGKITLKTESGAAVTISINDKTAFRRVAPGQTSIANAEQITMADIKIGDRILIPGGSNGEQTPVRQVIVMAREAITAQRNQETENRRARTINGRVLAVNPQNKEIIIQTRAAAGAQTITVSAPDNVKFLRYAPDSLKISDALPGTFTDVRPGDQIRIVGDRNAEGTRVSAEEIVSGSFMRSVGSIVEVNAARNEITVKNGESNQAITVLLGKNTTLRRIPDELAETLKQRANQRTERQRARSNRQNAGDSATQQTQERPNNRQNRRENRENARQQQPGQPNRAQLFENLPTVTINELKKGDAVLITVSSSANNSRLTAISVITGDSSLQQILRGRNNNSPNSPGLPGNVSGGNNVGDDEP